MSWADRYIEKLQNGEKVSFRPTGNSMVPIIHSKELVTVNPNIDNLKVGDVVLCKVKGKQYLHLISAISGERLQISNNKGYINGWISKNAIFGRLER